MGKFPPVFAVYLPICGCRCLNFLQHLGYAGFVDPPIPAMVFPRLFYEEIGENIGFGSAIRVDIIAFRAGFIVNLRRLDGFIFFRLCRQGVVVIVINGPGLFV